MSVRQAGGCQPPNRRARGKGLPLLNQRRLEVDLDLVADQEAAGFEGRVPGQAELLPADVGLGREARAGGAERVDGYAGEFDLQLNGLGDALDGEVARERVVLAVA